MARVLGEKGKSVAVQAAEKFTRLLLLIYVFVVVVAFVCGYLIGAQLAFYVSLIGMGAMIFLWRLVDKKFKTFEKERLNYRRGLSGEEIVGSTLENFPDDYCVIHDLTTPFGNIDHVVIGPTGAYIVDAKNWKGIVSADGNGELFLNGKPTQKTEVKNLTRRIMGIKEKIKVLCSLDPYIQGIFAFPSAYVEAKWGATGAVHCMKDEQLYDYIVENKRSAKLSKQDVETLSRAFLALASMDKEFGTQKI